MPLNDHKQYIMSAVVIVSHQSLEYHHRSTRGNPLMHSTLFVGGKFQAGRQGSQ